MKGPTTRLIEDVIERLVQFGSCGRRGLIRRHRYRGYHEPLNNVLEPKS